MTNLYMSFYILLWSCLACLNLC